MILEHVHISVASDQADAYLRAFKRARPLVQSQPGCHSCRLLPKLGELGEFLLLIKWESKVHHTEGFRNSEEYAEWSRLLHPFYEVSPVVEYYEIPELV